MRVSSSAAVVTSRSTGAWRWCRRKVGVPLPPASRLAQCLDTVQGWLFRVERPEILARMMSALPAPRRANKWT
jgi:hypothetical protein